MNYLDSLEKALPALIKNEEALVTRYTTKEKPWIWEEQRNYHEGRLDAYQGILEMVQEQIANEIMLWEKDLHDEYINNYPPIDESELF